MVMHTSTRKKIQKLAFFSGDYVYTDIALESNERYIFVSDECAIELLKDVAVTLSLIFGSFLLFLIDPMYVLITQHEIVLPVPVFFIFTDLTTTSGVIINIISQCISNGFAIVASIGIEIFNSMLKKTFHVCAATISFAIDELMHSIEWFEMSEMQIDYNFRNILIQIQDLDR